MSQAISSSLHWSFDGARVGRVNLGKIGDSVRIYYSRGWGCMSSLGRIGRVG